MALRVSIERSCEPFAHMDKKPQPVYTPLFHEASIVLRVSARGMRRGT